MCNYSFRFGFLYIEKHHAIFHMMLLLSGIGGHVIFNKPQNFIVDTLFAFGAKMNANDIFCPAYSFRDCVCFVIALRFGICIFHRHTPFR